MTSLFVQSDNPEELCFSANTTLEKLNHWSTVNSLQINSAKTKAVVFTPHQKLVDYNFILHIGNNPIEVVSEVKTLGVIFNQHLLWNTQVKRVLSSLAKVSGVLCKFRHILPVKIKLLVFNALFSAKISYCGLVWGTTSKNNIDKIFSIQKKALRHVANISYDTPLHDYHHSPNIVPFPEFYNFILLASYKRNLKNSNNSFLLLCNLRKVPDTGYTFRNKATWSIPFSRTNHGLDNIDNRIPRLSNDMASEDVNKESISISELKHYFVNSHFLN